MMLKIHYLQFTGLWSSHNSLVRWMNSTPVDQGLIFIKTYLNRQWLKTPLAPSFCTKESNAYVCSKIEGT